MHPELWLVPTTSLPSAADTVARVRDGDHVKAVALVGYRVDAEANAASRRLPYGYRGDGVEEIVFLRVEPTGVDLVFEDDAWPGEDRTWVTEDLDVALGLVLEFAAEIDLERTLVVVVGDESFHAQVTARRPDPEEIFEEFSTSCRIRRRQNVETVTERHGAAP